jgi:hypothetical protein
MNMRMIKDVLRLKFDGGFSHDRIAASLGISKGVVTKYVGLAGAAGLDWASACDMDEGELERRLLGKPTGHRVGLSRSRTSRPSDSGGRNAWRCDTIQGYAGLAQLVEQPP